MQSEHFVAGDDSSVTLNYQDIADRTALQTQLHGALSLGIAGHGSVHHVGLWALGFRLSAFGGCGTRSKPHALKSVRENSVVPPGLESCLPLSPALKRWASIGRPFGAGFCGAPSHRVIRKPVLTHTGRTPCCSGDRV